MQSAFVVLQRYWTLKIIFEKMRPLLLTILLKTWVPTKTLIRRLLRALLRSTSFREPSKNPSKKRVAAWPTVSNTELSDFWPSSSSGERAEWVPLNLFFDTVCKGELTEFLAELTGLPHNSVSSLFRSSTLSEVAPAKQTKERAKTKSSWISPICEFSCFSLGKQARFTLNFCSGTPLQKVHELAFVWFGLPGSLLTLEIRICPSFPTNRHPTHVHPIPISCLGSAGHGLSGPLWLRVQSRSSTGLRIAASIAFLFRGCFKGF